MRRMSRSSLAFLLFLVLAAAAFLYGLNEFNQRDDDGVAAGQPVTVVIPEGTSAAGVGEILAEAGVVESSLTFRGVAGLDERASQIQAGEYELRTGMNADDVLEILTSGVGAPDTFTVTIPEGLTVEPTLARIADAEDSPFTVEELEEALLGVAVPEWVPVDDLPEGAQIYEGLLFPLTYEFFVNENAQEVLATLVAETDEVLSGIEPPEGLTRYDVLIVASMIEREVRVPDERPVVASVIYNRLDAPMRLQIDATVQYAQGETGEQVLFEDLEIDSEWNTYETDGLPPTPIAAPGQAAIDAAANPADTEFLYYVVCDIEAGEHVFAESNAAHNANVAQFRRIREEGGSFCDA